MRHEVPGWLNHAVIYQIYPQSFSDSNGDGIGDLQGIVDRLDYIESLGANAIWLNPFFVSTFNDAGYDVADYYQVALRYGTNDDFKSLCDAAHDRGIKVIFDLVIGHCSWENEWFMASGQEERNKYSDWFIWTNSVWSPAPQGLEVIRGYLPRMGGYVTNFYVSQPAFNFGFAVPDPRRSWQQPMDAEGPMAVRGEVKKIIAHWFDLGADGFRADMALSLVKGDPDGRFTAKVWQDINGWVQKEYPEAVCIAEGGNPAIAIGQGLFHIDFCLPWRMPSYNSLFRKDASNEGGSVKGMDAFGFSVFDESGHGNIQEFMSDFERHYADVKETGFISIPVGNHDFHPRISKGRDEAGILQAVLFSFTMPGVPTLYYGDEIGMKTLEGLPSKEGSYDRSGIRTPMQWDSSVNAGFSSAEAEHLYFPIDADEERPTVEKQDRKTDSLLHQLKSLIELKRDYEALASDAGFKVLYAVRGKFPIVYERSKGGECCLVAINPTGREVAVEIRWESLNMKCLFGQVDALERMNDQTWKIRLTPVSGGIYRKI
ncbi:MAG: glycosylase [Anaerolineaceae bacterium]|nr:glycosylase [Anaerolineaceae bacterium]